MKKGLISILLAGILVIGTLTGCGSDNGSSDSSSTAEADSAAASTETASDDDGLIDVDFAVSSDGFGGLLPVIAAYGDTDAEFGLNFVLQNITTASDTLAAVQSGKVDIGGFSAPAPLLSISEGTDLTIIGGQMSNYESLIVQPENEELWAGDLTEEFLSGKKIGVNRTNSGDIALRAYFAETGIDLSKIEYVELDSGASVVEAVSKGSVDAGIINGGFYQSAEDSGLVNVRFIKDIIGEDFICCRQLASPESIEANRELYVNIEKALIRAYEIYRSDPETSVELGANFITKDKEDIQYITYEYGDLGLSPDPNLNGIKDYYEGMKASGYIDADTEVAIEDHVDTSIYEEALTELLESDPDNEYYQELQEAFEVNDK